MWIHHILLVNVGPGCDAAFEWFILSQKYSIAHGTALHWLKLVKLVSRNNNDGNNIRVTSDDCVSI